MKELKQFLIELGICIAIGCLCLLFFYGDVRVGINNILVFFYPTKEIYFSLDKNKIPHEEVVIDTYDRKKLYGYLLYSPLTKTKKTTIFFTGNGGNVSNWYGYSVEMQKHVPVNVLIVDYRGYGKSTGIPDIKNSIKDTETIYDYLINRGCKPEDISAYGSSLGAPFALELALHRKLKGIVIQSSFTTLKSLSKKLYPWMPEFIIMNDLLNCETLIKKVQCPIFITHGELDDIIPVSNSYRLYELANEPKKLFIVKGAKHHDFDKHLDKEFFNALKNLFI